VFSKIELSQLKYFIFAMVIAAFYVVAVHLYEGIYTRYKFMGDAKYTFGFMFLLVSLWALRRFTWSNLVLFSICAIVLGLSLERKGILISFLTLLTVVPLVNLRVSVFLHSLALIFIQVFCLVSGFIAYQWLVKGNIAVTHYVDESRALWESNLHRGNLLGNGIEIFQSSPWFGVGAKQLDDHMQAYYLSEKLAHYTHNWYLDFFIEYGIIGVVCFFLPVIWIMLKIRPNHKYAWLCIPLAAYCLSVPALMANGTTTMLIYFTAIASIFVLGARSES
jgi:O-antigen ligase